MDPLEPAISALHSESRLRVWSLVITVFGDCVQHRGGAISTARLGRLLGRIGVEPGALRTALSRLGRDGWVVSERAGRISHYRLSTSGLARFTEASSRIYAAPRITAVTDWALSSEGSPQTAVPLGGLWLAPASVTPPKRPAFRITGQITDLAPAMRDSLIHPDHAAALHRLMADLDRLAKTPADPLSHAAARILLIHRWRRIVLRFPELPPDMLPSGLNVQDPRARVALLYHHLTPATESWLDSAEGEITPMPAQDTSLAPRFGASQPA
ncbi:MAG: PaaX family transcriptional regulator C-terminal domain-containing protein [Rhodobacterales bacterium]